MFQTKEAQALYSKLSACPSSFLESDRGQSFLERACEIVERVEGKSASDYFRQSIEVGIIAIR